MFYDFLLFSFIVYFIGQVYDDRWKHCIGLGYHFSTESYFSKVINSILPTSFTSSLRSLNSPGSGGISLKSYLASSRSSSISSIWSIKSIYSPYAGKYCIIQSKHLKTSPLSILDTLIRIRSTHFHLRKKRHPEGRWWWSTSWQRF